jgi:hypothetical protein
MAENRRNSGSPERAMALWALVPAVPAAILAFALGSIVGLGVGVSAALGVVVAVGGFCAQVLALGWAREIGEGANMAVALFGFLVLLGLVGGAYALLKTNVDWFSPKAFGGGLMALLPVVAYEAHLAKRGRIAEIALDADRAAAAARTKERT